MPDSCALIRSALGKGESNRGSGTGFVRTDFNGTTMLFDKRLGKKQAKSEALALGSEKRLEDVSRRVGVDSRAGIGEFDHQLIILTPESYPHSTAIRHRLHRIGYHIHEAGAHFFSIHIQHRGNAVGVLDYLDSLALHLGLGDGEHTVDQLLDVG